MIKGLIDKLTAAKKARQINDAINVELQRLDAVSKLEAAIRLEAAVQKVQEAADKVSSQPPDEAPGAAIDIDQIDTGIPPAYYAAFTFDITQRAGDGQWVASSKEWGVSTHPQADPEQAIVKMWRYVHLRGAQVMESGMLLDMKRAEQEQEQEPAGDEGAV